MPVKKKSKQLIGRHADLDFFEQQYKSSLKSHNLILLSGRFRLGKTTLLKAFCKNKPHIYYYANPGSSFDQLQSLVDFVIAEFEDTNTKNKSINIWELFFEYLALKLENLKTSLVFILDDFFNLLDSNSELIEKFNYFWSKYLIGKKIFLILVVPDLKSQTATKILEIKAVKTWSLQTFDYQTTKKYLQSKNFEKAFILYTLVGGVPAYLEQFNIKKTLKENILDTFLNQNSYLSLEAKLIMATTFKDPKIYLSIQKAIGFGGKNYNYLVNQTGLDINTISAYLSNLIKANLVIKVVPITNPQSKKGLYFISDNYLQFYFSFVFTSSSLIELGNFETLFKQKNSEIQKLITSQYQRFAIEFVEWAGDQQLIPKYEFLGSWWNDQSQINVVGFNQNNNSWFFLDSFWGKKLTGLKELEILKSKVKNGFEKIDYANCKFGLMSNKGFTTELLKTAQRENILLIKGDTIM